MCSLFNQGDYSSILIQLAIVGAILITISNIVFYLFKAIKTSDKLFKPFTHTFGFNLHYETIKLHLLSIEATIKKYELDVEPIKKSDIKNQVFHDSNRVILKLTQHVNLIAVTQLFLVLVFYSIILIAGDYCIILGLFVYLVASVSIFLFQWCKYAKEDFYGKLGRMRLIFVAIGILTIIALLMGISLIYGFAAERLFFYIPLIVIIVGKIVLMLRVAIIVKCRHLETTALIVKKLKYLNTLKEKISERHLMEFKQAYLVHQAKW